METKASPQKKVCHKCGKCLEGQEKIFCNGCAKVVNREAGSAATSAKMK
ncbi:MAG: hypothetical protein KGJ89_01070 [Patescibacteria group bacterium]|nr:hypothetical protein [Patescibacteria group bacterium]MDE2015104.1 hypothetical protein [Patescibacteria group bacterium]MDE2226532.1 hypothetical protein [Patescibacteria group bacterium]